MPVKGVRCVLGYVLMEDHHKCMVERPGPPCLIPATILQRITRHDGEREELGIEFSPSSLSNCHRKTVLSRDHDVFINVRDMYKPERGSIYHSFAVHDPPWPGILGTIRELRMSAPISTKYGEQKFWGKADLIVLRQMDGGTLHIAIEDLKTKGEVGHERVEADHEHVRQINEYAWIVQKFLPSWLNKRYGVTHDCQSQVTFTMEEAESYLHMNLNDNVELPHIDEVIVDELTIVYADMSRTRIFTSRGFLYDSGKMLGEKGEDGRWHRFDPPQHEELELAPIHMFATSFTESIIRKGIESRIEAKTLLAPPLTGDAARLQCRSCPVRGACIDIGLKEGRDMSEQEVYGAV